MFHEGGSSIDKNLVVAKLSKLREYIGFLKELQAVSREDLVRDFKIRGAIERYLQVSIECMIDVGNEIISSLQLQRPERYRDIPYILAKAGIIPKDYAETMASMIGFRNLLVHDYASINLDLVYEFLQTKLSDLNAFIKYIAKWLEGKAWR
ncbi:MAG: DUF86 domain-containing protein [Nitrososphaerota archaeon]